MSVGWQALPTSARTATIKAARATLVKGFFAIAVSSMGSAALARSEQ